MTDNTQPEAVADCIFRLRGLRHVDRHEVAHAMESMVARIADLEAQLEAIGAGGVSGPLLGQPQAMPDLSVLTERGAKAWAGVDAQGLREGRWYMVNKDGMATLCADQADAEQGAKEAQTLWPHMEPHRVVQLVEAGHASAAANAGSEPVHARILEADLAKLTERGAKAWAGVDPQDLRDGGKQ